MLNAALAERDAGFAILVVASDEKVPAGREPLQEYEGNKMIVTLDKETLDGRAPRAGLPLRALPLPDGDRARARARRGRRARCRRGGAVGAEGRPEDPQLADRAPPRASTAARETLDAMVDRVKASLERVESLIAAA